jgi:DNA repair exonuclease SbcCD ATPase subunit
MAVVASRLNKISRARPGARQASPAARENDGKALVSVDLAEINHAPLPARAPADHQAVTGLLKAKIETLQAELAKVEAMATGHRADFERERDRADKLMVDADKLMAELLKMTAETLRAELDAMTAKEATARLEGELAALKARPWWRRLAV